MTDDAPAALVWSHPDRALLTLHRVLAGGTAGAAGIALTAAVAAEEGGSAGIAAALLSAVVVGLVLVTVRRRFEALGYAERDDDLLVRRGVLVRRTSVVPYGRMQYVDVTAGPLDRRLGLATVVLHTAAAASDASVPGLREAEATRLRDRLAALGQARAAGV